MNIKEFQNKLIKDYSYQLVDDGIWGEPTDKAVKDLLAKKKAFQHPKSINVADVLENMGFAYNYEQSLYYSVNNPKQRNFGYCSLYDILSLYVGMVIECEPVYFTHNNENWLIELWKGQYGLSSGAEIGIYKKPRYHTNNLFNSVSDGERLYMEFTLTKKSSGTILMNRSGLHWWLTGFLPGVFSEPSDLILDAKITFNDSVMLNVCANAISTIGYPINIQEETNTLHIRFDKPKTKQPSAFMTNYFSDKFQKSNKKMCMLYEKLKKKNGIPDNSPESIEKYTLGNSKSFIHMNFRIKKFVFTPTFQ